MARTENERRRDESVVNLLVSILATLEKVLIKLENKNARK
jgi:hypothetical protein